MFCNGQARDFSFVPFIAIFLCLCFISAVRDLLVRTQLKKIPMRAGEPGPCTVSLRQLPNIHEPSLSQMNFSSLHNTETIMTTFYNVVVILTWNDLVWYVGRLCFVSRSKFCVWRYPQIQKPKFSVRSRDVICEAWRDNVVTPAF